MPPDKKWPEELKEKMKDAYHAEFDLEAARAGASLPKNHAWRQRGPHVVCSSCFNEHAFFVGIDKNLTTNEEGEYVLTNRF